MTRREKLKGRTSLFLIIGILILIVCFVIISCGTDPQLKVQDPDAGQFAVDFTECPGEDCQFNLESNSFSLNKYKIGNKEVTVEAWIKPKSTSTSLVVSRQDKNTGIGMTIEGMAGNTEKVNPKFNIRRLVTHPTTFATSTVSYVVSAASADNIPVNDWSHVAGIIANSAHSHAVTTDCTVEAMAETPHLDFFVNGNFSDCATSRGKTVFIDLDPIEDNAVPLGFAHEPSPGFKQVNSLFNGILDEVRIWTTDRSDLISTCKDMKLGYNSGECGRDNDNLIGYLRFNEGEGVNGKNSTTSDTQGLGIGGLEYPNPDPDDPKKFLGWETGWTTDTPF